MGHRRRSNPKQARTAGASAYVDRITDLPLVLRVRIASFLRYQQVVKLSVLARPWRHIHRHTPVVEMNLSDFLYLTELGYLLDEEHVAPGLLDEGAILAARVALGGRAQDGIASEVDTLRFVYYAYHPRMRRHGRRIIELADARQIHIHAYRGHAHGGAWTLDLPPAARSLEVVARLLPAPTIGGPSAAALRKLSLDTLVLRDWPRLPSLRSLNLDSVTVVPPARGTGPLLLQDRTGPRRHPPAAPQVRPDGFPRRQPQRRTRRAAIRTR
jgi:hypothetical protein